MSEYPSTPPELSSREDTPPNSLLAQLRQITGRTEAELPAPPPEADEPGGPPVDKLIIWLREAAGVLTACGIIVTVMLAVATLWLWERTLEGRLYARQWQRRRAERRLARANIAPPAVELAPPVPITKRVEDEATSEVEEAPLAPEVADVPRAAQCVPPVPITEFVEEPAISEVEVPPQSAELADMPPGVEEPGTLEEKVTADRRTATPRRRWRALLVAVPVIAVMPALLLVPAVRFYFTGLLGWGNAAVVAGADGWLFPRSVIPDSPAPLRETAAALRAHGASLIVVSVPAKAAVYPEKLDPSLGSGLQRHPGAGAAHKELTDAGALLLDLGPVLHALKSGDTSGDFVFRPQSSRWSPRGVEKSASVAATLLQQQPGYAALPLRPLQLELARLSIPEPGDDLAAAFPSKRFRDAHPAQPLHCIRLLDAEKKPVVSDPASPVAVLGGADIRLYDEPGFTPTGEPLSAGFAQYLALYLSTPLEIHAGPDALSAASEWLRVRSPEEQKAKRFIIWVIADDDLRP